jgi:hypothetical protein
VAEIHRGPLMSDRIKKNTGTRPVFKIKLSALAAAPII